ncbi:MAG: benzoyl-CoA 2,3-epoxidase subunit BoxB, partial [Acidobacteriota bacterium]|nr:benzoyl-CoA 2,3-epoxidase subunit BoxB [Acidobacteriota bacterium]
NAMNEILRDDYVRDCERGLARWNRILEEAGLGERLTLPNRRFHRQIGAYSGHRFDPEGRLIDEGVWQRKSGEWLPTADDREYVRQLMVPVYEPGKMATWIAPPRSGVDGKPIGYEYVKRP